MASYGDAELDELYSSDEDEDEWQEKNIRCLVRTRSVEDCLAPLIVQVRTFSKFIVIIYFVKQISEV